MKRKRITGYSKSDVTTALVLKSISAKALRYLQGKKFLALPSPRTQQRWIKDFKCEPGLQTDCLKVMEETLSSESDYNRLCIIGFDEVQIKKSIEYDNRTRRIYGPCKKLQNVMVKGLFGNWKQSIYYNFDTNMTKGLLLQIIRDVESYGSKVIAMVFDLGNKSLISELRLDHLNHSIPNPVDPTRQIFAFPDCPHLLKLFRNHILDTGVLIPDGDNFQSLTRKHFEEILDKDNGELKLAYKITRAHIDPQGSAKQNVRMAAQLLSATVSKAMCFINRENPDHRRLQSEAVLTINNWFDVMNSRKPTNGDKSCISFGFGLHANKQLEALEKMEALVHGMKVFFRKRDGSLIPRQTMLPFQQGILMSIASIRALLDYTKREYQATYILTAKVNQDFIENFFTQFRSLFGPNTHPSPVEAMQRYRILQIGQHSEIVAKNPSVAVEEDQETVLTVQVARALDPLPASSEKQVFQPYICHSLWYKRIING